MRISDARKNVLRFSFITWTAFLNKLPTLDKIRKWGVNVEPCCILCKTQEESRDHLLFECDYSKSVWREGVRRNCSYLGSDKWRDIVQYMKQMTGQEELRKLMMKLFWTAATYRLWMERNRRKQGEAEEIT